MSTSTSKLVDRLAPNVGARCHDELVNDVVDLLERPTYGLAQVDRVLGLTAGTARRWIDGYSRGGRSYPPVVRETQTGSDVVTWGEFVEARLLAEFRDSGVTLAKMRPAVERLREELSTPYPLASNRAWLDSDGRELIRRVQEDVGLDRRLSLVVVRTGQGLLDWSDPVRGFVGSIEWDSDTQVVRRLRPESDIPDVVLDPLMSFGEPTVRGVRTEIIAELVRAGETPEGIAETYELPRTLVDAAIRYELLRGPAS
jgi:uncharacterized protein (DUF433 family)